MVEIRSMDDERLAAYRQLQDPRALGAAGLFVVEGRLVVARLLALASGPGPWHGRIDSLLLTPTAHAQLRSDLERCPIQPVYVVRQEVMNGVVGFNIHRGCLALVRRPPPRLLDDDAIAGATTMVVLEGVNNPDNVGGIFRSSAAFGADLVVLGPGCADPLYRKSVRTSMGAALVLPFAESGPWTDALLRIRGAGAALAALSPAADSAPLPEWRPPPGKIALLAGAEGAGLSRVALEAAAVRLSIPMTERVGSLNVHTAVAIGLYHLMVSRRP